MKKLFACWCAAAFASVALATMEPATPESQGVSSKAILGWLDACEKTFGGGGEGSVHGFVFVRHGKVVAEGSWKPYDTLNETHMLYSHSKSFVSTAVGFAVDEGRIDLDDRIVDIFTNELPAAVSENLAQLRVRDLLTMNVGKLPHRLRGKESWVRQFLAQEFIYKPGTRFRYDSDGTYMLAAIVERRTGQKMMDYLRQKMFDKIGIKKAWTTYSSEGIACGGWGLNMTTRELARFGQFYLQKGSWDGEQLLSPDWVALATSRETWSKGITIQSKVRESGSDWQQGYGFQFWRCRHGAYRADGSSGQITVVMPEQDAVVSMHAGLGDIQAELNLIWDHLLPAMRGEALPEDTATQKALASRLASLALPPVAGRTDIDIATYVGRAIELKSNSVGCRSVRLDATNDGWQLSMEMKPGVQKIPVGCGEWMKGSMRIDPGDFEDMGTYIGEHRTAASGGIQDDGTVRIRVYLTGDPGVIDLSIRPDGGLTGNFNTMNGGKLVSK